MEIVKKDGEYKKYPIIEHTSYTIDNIEYYIIKIQEDLNNGQKNIRTLKTTNKDDYIKIIKKGCVELKLPTYQIR